MRVAATLCLAVVGATSALAKNDFGPLYDVKWQSDPAIIACAQELNTAMQAIRRLEEPPGSNGPSATLTCIAELHPDVIEAQSRWMKQRPDPEAAARNLSSCREQSEIAGDNPSDCGPF